MSLDLREELRDLPARFEQGGYAVVRNVIDADLIDEARRHVDWLISKNPDRRPEWLSEDLMPHDPFWLRLVSDDRLLDVVEQFVGPDIALFASHHIAKPPHDGQPVLFHQDGAYWPLEPMKVVTIVLWLDDTCSENGCLRVIPGTHRLELQETRERKDIPNVLDYTIDEGAYDESAAVDLELQAGDISLHHPHVIHGSNANTTNGWRRGLNIQYIPTATRITELDWPCAFHLRGKTVPGVNQYQPFPKYVLGEHFAFRGCEAWLDG